MQAIPIEIAEVTARTEQVARDAWTEAERVGVGAGRKDALMNAVRVAYLIGVSATLEAVARMQRGMSGTT